MEKSVGKHLHGGHRKRLKDRFLREGLDGFEKHNMLEMLLFYALPQRDTNPIAHALIDRFGSLSGVFDASVAELCKVDGVSEHTAVLIKLVPAIHRAALCETPPAERYDSLNKIGKLLVRYYTGVTVETVYLVLLDNDYRLIDVVKVGEGSVNRVRLETRKLIEYCLRANASMVVLAHNHPRGNTTPSSEDMATTAEVANVFRSINVEFLEHLLISGDRYEPLLSTTEGVFWQHGRTRAFYRND